MTQRTRYFILALFLFCFLQAADGLLTHGAVGGGFAQEANWLVAGLVTAGSFPLFKLMGAFLCVIILWVVYKRFPGLAVSAASTLVIFYSAVMTWNLHILAAI